MKSKKICAILLIIIFGIMLVVLSGCKFDSFGTAKEVETKLEEKYNESFKTKSIGDRVNTNYTKLFCYPENNKNMLFTVYYYDDGKMTDDYTESKIIYKLNIELKAILKKKNIEFDSYLLLSSDNRDSNKDYSKMSVNEYLKDIKIDNIFIMTAVFNVDNFKTDKNIQDLKDALKEFSDNHDSIPVIIGAYFVKDFDTVVKKYFNEYARVTDSMILDYYKNSDGSKREATIHVNKTKGVVEDFGMLKDAVKVK